MWWKSEKWKPLNCLVKVNLLYTKEFLSAFCKPYAIKIQGVSPPLILVLLWLSSEFFFLFFKHTEMWKLFSSSTIALKCCHFPLLFSYSEVKKISCRFWHLKGSKKELGYRLGLPWSFSSALQNASCSVFLAFLRVLFFLLSSFPLHSASISANLKFE